MRIHKLYTQISRSSISCIIIFQIAFMPLAAHAQQTGTPELDQPVVANFKPAQNEPEIESRIALDGEREKVYAELYENFTGGSKFNPLDYFSLLRQDYVDTRANEVSSTSPASVTFKALNAKFQVVKEFTARESLYDNFNGILPSDTDKFQIFVEGKLLHHFRVPVEAIAVLGDYIVFIEKGSFNSADNFRHISFIDLNYFRLSKSKLPIFRVPVQGVENISSFEVRNSVLYINDKPYEMGLFNFAANLNRILFNVAVNATEPTHLMRVIQSLEPFIEAFNANLSEAQKESNDKEYKVNLQKSLASQLQQLQGMKDSVENIDEAGLKKLSETFEKPVTEAMGKVHENLQMQRSLIGSLSMVWQQMTIPRPAEVGKLEEKIVTVAVGLSRDRLKISDMYELASELATSRKVRLSIGAIAAAATAYYFPDQSIQALRSTLEMVEYVGGVAFGKVVDFTDIAYRTAGATLSGFNPINFYETYLADGAWKRTSVGLSAMFSIVVLVVGIPHLIVNTYYLIKNMATSKNLQWRSAEANASRWEFLRRIVPNFIQRQKNLHQEYLDSLAVDKKNTVDDLTNQKLPQISKEEMIEKVREFIAKMDAQYSANESLMNFSLKTKVWGAISLFTEVHLPTVIKAGDWTKTQWKKFQNIENFAGALSSFVFSFAAFTKSGVFYATTWNYFYMSRLLILNPRMALTFMMYPNFFRRAVATELGQVTPPSFWNGGTRWIWQEVSVKLSQITHAQQYAALKKFESEVVPVEKKINQEALTEALKALQRYLNYNVEQVLKISESSISKKLSSPDIGKLSYDARTFFATYYDLLVERSMRRYLYVQALTEEVDVPALNSKEIKKWFLGNDKTVIPNLVDPKLLVKSQVTEEVYMEAFARVHYSEKFLEKIDTANRHKAIRGLDSETNGKIRRFVIAEQQMKKGSAMARAVRANIVALIVDKPMELLLLFVLTAGITDGPNKPLYDVMFSENSAFYLSRNIFMGYVAGLLVSIFADVWVKIQQDTRVDKLGGFDQVPEGEYAKKGFWSWYRFQFTSNPKNKWWDHHKYNSEIIYHNMGPAFILMTAMGMVTLGRVDLDFYFLGYIVAFFLPFTGLSLKLEQTFEIASGWILREVPKELREHPLILEWANKKITRLRMGFQLYYKFYENVLGAFLGNLMAITTMRNGTRALSRILFGGKTLTEHLIEKTTAGSGIFPGMKYVDKACRFLFGNNYTSGVLPPPPH